MKKFEIRLLSKPMFPYGQRTILETRVMHGENETELYELLYSQGILFDCDDFLVLEHR